MNSERKDRGGHGEIIVNCPRCSRAYVNQTGGQKSGASPAIRVVKPGYGPRNKAQGFCSAFCSLESIGTNPETISLPSWFSPEGIKTPPRLLAPARRLNKENRTERG